MSTEVANQVSFFHSQLQLRRFNAGTLRILESILVTKDVKSLLEIRNGLKKLLRSDSVSYLREIAEQSIEQKLSVLEFFVRAFALTGDVESCLALRYEALLLRERESISQDCLRVLYEEWLTFANDSLDNGFYSIAVKGCENALSSIKSKNFVEYKPNIYVADNEALEEIKKVRDVAAKLAASHSVRVQTTEYLRNKTIQQSRKNVSVPTRSQCSASSMFRNMIKKRNLQKLHQLQSLQSSEE